MIRTKLMSAFKRVPSLSLEVQRKEVNEETPAKRLFIHIPKTAGTSLRHSLLEADNVCLDYGEKSSETSEIIKDFCYGGGQDPYAAYLAFQQSDFDWLCGHVPAAKYLNWFMAQDVVVFLRDPIQQMISHFNHFSKHHDYKSDFTSFYRKKSFQNIQSKYLAGVPIALIGVAGVTEEYDGSLELINHHFSSSYGVKRSNVNNSKSVFQESLSEEMKAELSTLLESDMRLYGKAKRLFHERSELDKLAKRWCYALANLNANLVLSGCAYYDGSDDSVELGVLINDQHVQDIYAIDFYGAHSKLNLPRKRMIGFRVPLSKYMTSQDRVTLVVKDTGQTILVDS